MNHLPTFWIKDRNVRIPAIQYLHSKPRLLCIEYWQVDSDVAGEWGGNAFAPGYGRTRIRSTWVKRTFSSSFIGDVGMSYQPLNRGERYQFKSDDCPSVKSWVALCFGASVQVTSQCWPPTPILATMTNCSAVQWKKFHFEKDYYYIGNTQKMKTY
jgi:hypothetical protein